MADNTLGEIYDFINGRGGSAANEDGGEADKPKHDLEVEVGGKKHGLTKSQVAELITKSETLEKQMSAMSERERLLNAKEEELKELADAWTGRKPKQQELTEMQQLQQEIISLKTKQQVSETTLMAERYRSKHGMSEEQMGNLVRFCVENGIANLDIGRKALLFDEIQGKPKDEIVRRVASLTPVNSDSKREFDEDEYLSKEILSAFIN